MDPDLERAVERDLISVGLRLRWLGDGSDRLSWRDLSVILQEAPRNSAIGRHVLGDNAEWGASEYLLAAIVDGVNGGNWQRGGGKSPRPKPVPRPGDLPGRVKRVTETRPEPEGDPFDDNQSGVFRGVATPLDELNEWLGWAA